MGLGPGAQVLGNPWETRNRPSCLPSQARRTLFRTASEPPGESAASSPAHSRSALGTPLSVAGPAPACRALGPYLAPALARGRRSCGGSAVGDPGAERWAQRPCAGRPWPARTRATGTLGRRGAAAPRWPQVPEGPRHPLPARPAPRRFRPPGLSRSAPPARLPRRPPCRRRRVPIPASRAQKGARSPVAVALGLRVAKALRAVNEKGVRRSLPGQLREAPGQAAAPLRTFWVGGSRGQSARSKGPFAA